MKLGIFQILICLIFSLSCTFPLAGQWFKISDVGYSSYDIQFFDDTIGFLIGDQFVFKTTDGGYTWDSTELGNSLDLLLEFDFIDPDTGYIVGDVSGYQGFYTMNQGGFWIPTTPYILYGQVAMVNGNEAIVARYPAEPAVYHLYFTEGSVETLLPGISGNDITVFPHDTIYVGGGGFAKSIDNGENWTVTEMPGILYMDFPNSRVGYTTFDDQLFKTTDYGDSWTELELPDYFDACTALEFVNDSVGYYPCTKSASYDGIMKTNDGGEIWIFNDFSPASAYSITGISCINKDTCWCVTYSGEIYATTNGGGSQPDTVISNASLYEKPVFDVYPNPVKSILHFSMEGMNGLSTIETYNSFGSLIETTISDNNSINVEAFPPGVYISIIKASTGYYSSKWVKI